MGAVDPILTDAAELARVVAHAHQGAATQLIGEGWKHARKFISLSEKYAAWADYRASAQGFGIHAYAHKSTDPFALQTKRCVLIPSGATSEPKSTSILRCEAGWPCR